MPSELTISKQEDSKFFTRLLVETDFVRSMLDSGFEEPRLFILASNAGMTVTKDDWYLTVPGSTHKLNIHFEARSRNQFRIEVGTDPYESALDKKPELKLLLALVITLRVQLMEALRALLQSAGVLPSDITVSTSNLRNARSVEAHTIVKFNSGLASEPSPKDTAEFFAYVVRAP